MKSQIYSLVLFSICGKAHRAQSKRTGSFLTRPSRWTGTELFEYARHVDPIMRSNTASLLGSYLHGITQYSPASSSGMCCHGKTICFSVRAQLWPGQSEKLALGIIFAPLFTRFMLHRHLM